MPVAEFLCGCIVVYMFLDVSCIFHACFMMCVYVTLWFSDTFRRNFGDPRSYKTFGIRAASPVFFFGRCSPKVGPIAEAGYIYIYHNGCQISFYLCIHVLDIVYYMYIYMYI